MWQSHPPSGEKQNGEEGKESGQEEGQEALAATGAVLTDCPTLFTNRAQFADRGREKN